MLSADFFSKSTFLEKFFLEYLQSVKQLGSRSGLTFCLIRVQNVCKFYQQTTLVGKELINHIILATVIVMWESVKKHAFLFRDQA